MFLDSFSLGLSVITCESHPAIFFKAAKEFIGSFVSSSDNN